jgi:hypothetical protein
MKDKIVIAIAIIAIIVIGYLVFKHLNQINTAIKATS